MDQPAEIRCFSWDEDKRESNLRKHGIDFADVAAVFDGRSIEDLDLDHGADEERWRRVVMLDQRFIVVIYVERGRETRLISARPSTPAESRVYFRDFFG